MSKNIICILNNKRAAILVSSITTIFILLGGYYSYSKKYIKSEIIDINRLELIKSPIIEEIEKIAKEKEEERLRIVEEERIRLAAEEEVRKKAEEEERLRLIAAEEEQKRLNEEKIIEENKPTLNTPVVNIATDNDLLHYNKNGLKIDITPIVKTNPNKVYWIVDIETSNSNSLKYALSNNSWGGTRQTTSSNGASHNAVLAFNASGFSFDTGAPVGSVYISDGVILQDGKSIDKTMAIDIHGNLFTPKVGTTAQELINQGVKYTTQFGPVLVNNGERTEIVDGRPSYAYPRTAIGQRGPNSYTLVVADGKRDNYSIGLTSSELQDIFIEKGCYYAYNLDGGGSTSLYFNGRLINKPSDGEERPVADIFYFN